VSSLRYYVLAANGPHVVELFKLEQAPRRAVITSSTLGRMVEIDDIHMTHHPPNGGKATRIIHMSDAKGTDVRIPLEPAADVVELGRAIIDLSDFDWEGSKKFTKRSYAEKYVLDVAREGACIYARFYMGPPQLLSEALDALARSGKLDMYVLKPGGFGTAPPGHRMTCARLVFDDEAEVTLGCLLLASHRPDIDSSAEKPWSGPRFKWVAYGSGGQVAEGGVDAG
jgi:hypothetical protein